MSILKEAFSSWTVLDVMVYVVIPLFIGFVIGRCK